MACPLPIGCLYQMYHSKPAAYPDDMTFAAVLGPFYCTALWLGRAEQRGGVGGCAILGSSLSAPAAEQQQQQDTRSSSRAAKPHLPSYHKHMRCADLQQRKAAQMGTMHDGCYK